MEDEVRTHALLRIFAQQGESQLIAEGGLLVVIPAFDEAFRSEQVGQDGLAPAALKLLLAAHGVGEPVGLAAYLAALHLQLADRRVEALAQRRGVLGLRLFACLEGVLHGRQVARQTAAYALEGLPGLAAQLLLAFLEYRLRARGHLSPHGGHLLLQTFRLLLAQGLLDLLLGESLQRAALPAQRHDDVRQRPHHDECGYENDPDYQI